MGQSSFGAWILNSLFSLLQISLCSLWCSLWQFTSQYLTVLHFEHILSFSSLPLSLLPQLEHSVTFSMLFILCVLILCSPVLVAAIRCLSVQGLSAVFVSVMFRVLVSAFSGRRLDILDPFGSFVRRVSAPYIFGRFLWGPVFVDYFSNDNTWVPYLGITIFGRMSLVCTLLRERPLATDDFRQDSLRIGNL